MAKMIEVEGVQFSLDGFKGFSKSAFLKTVEYQKSTGNWPKSMDGQKAFDKLTAAVKKRADEKAKVKAKNIKDSEDKAKKSETK